MRASPTSLLFAAIVAYNSRVSASPPKFVRPALPTAGKAIPKGEAWLHELKLDGYRFQIVKGARACEALQPERLRLDQAPPGLR